MNSPYQSPIALPDLLDAAIKRGCEVCMGEGLVCEEHPLKSWESGYPTDCTCGAAGMPCACTGLNDLPAQNEGAERG